MKTEARIRRLAPAVFLLATFSAIPEVLALQPAGRPGAPPNSVTGDMLRAMSETNFDLMTIKQGLPHDSVYGFTQDTTGYVWIATFGGLARYDGYQVRSYLHDAAVPGSLPDNNIRVLLPRENGGLYIGTGSAGLVLYDAATDSFHIPEKTPESLRRSRVFGMAPDGKGGVWFGTQSGAAHYDAQAGAYEVFGAISGHPRQNGFPDGAIFSLLVDRSGNLWVGGDNGLYLRRPGSSQFVAVPGMNGPRELGEKPSIWSIFQDHAGSIWVGSDVTGLGTVDLAANRMRGYRNLAGPDCMVGAHTVRGFIELDPGVLEVATYGGGLFHIDTNRGTVVHWVKDPTASAPLRNDFVRGIFQDRSGVIWVGTDSGLSRTIGATRGIFNIRSSPLRPEGLFGSEVRSVGAGYGRVWVGFDQGGFAEIDRDGSVHRIQAAPGMSRDQVSHREVLAIKTADEKTVIAGGVGLYAIDVRTRTYRIIDHPLLNKQLVNALWIDGDLVWVGCYNGLIRYNRRTRQIRVFAHDPSDRTTLADNYVRDMLKSRDGRFWITTRLGLDLFDPSTETFRHIRHDDSDPGSMVSDNIQPIAEDEKGRLWIGTIGSGLSVLDHWEGDKPRFVSINRKRNGLPDDTVLVIRRGLDGVMWVNTLAGLAVVRPGNLSMDVYGAPDGMQINGQNLFSSALLEDGTFLFPGSSSLMVVLPQRLRPWTFKAPLVLTQISIPGVANASAMLARQAMEHTLQFPSHRGFEASFALLDYTDPESTQYSYQLDGFDDQWSETSSTRRLATYTNLPAGSYHFKVRAASRGGLGPKSEMDIPIEIMPQGTERWWFQALLTLAIIAAIIALLRFRLAFMQHRQQELEAEIAARTAELEQSRLELMEVNRQLETLALHDVLTGTLNRRGFFERADLEVSRARRTGRNYSLLLADLDNFKQVNDTMGHGMGDAVLKSVAALLVGSVRTSDIVARFGGEEFVVLLPETDPAQAIQLAERLRAQIEEMMVEYAGLAFHVTTSIGLATSAGKDESLEALLSRTDQALYRAKHSGKNCVRQAELIDI